MSALDKSLWVLLVHFSGLMWEAYPVDSGCTQGCLFEEKMLVGPWGEDNVLPGKVNTD